MNEELLKIISINIPVELDNKIRSLSKKEGINKSKFIRKVIEEFFEKQDEKEILNVILQRLDEIKSMSKDCEIFSARANSFLNTSSEFSMNPEDYKKLREKVLKDVNTYISSKGYNKK